jgi:hypothetical protein
MILRGIVFSRLSSLVIHGVAEQDRAHRRDRVQAGRENERAAASGHRQVIASLQGADRSGGHLGVSVASGGGHGTKEITPCTTR